MPRQVRKVRRSGLVQGQHGVERRRPLIPLRQWAVGRSEQRPKGRWDAGVVARRGGDHPGRHVGRDDDGRDPHPQQGEVEERRLPAQQKPEEPPEESWLWLPAGGRDASWRTHVVVQATVLVVGDEEDGSLEQLRVGPERFVDLGDESLGPGEVPWAAGRAAVVVLVGDKVVAWVLAAAVVVLTDDRKVRL